MQPGYDDDIIDDFDYRSLNDYLHHAAYKHVYDHDARRVDINYDIEHHVDHLVDHPFDKHYLYDPVHDFIIVKPPGYDDKLAAAFDDEYHDLIERAVEHYNDDDGQHHYDSA